MKNAVFSISTVSSAFATLVCFCGIAEAKSIPEFFGFVAATVAFAAVTHMLFKACMKYDKQNGKE